MKKIIIILLIVSISILYFGCRKKEKEKSISITNEKNNITVSEVESKNTTLMEKSKEINANVEKEEVSVSNSDEKFFKGGIIKKNGEEIGIYIVESGDSVWEIAKKYANYLKGENTTKTDIGNVAYRINKENFKDLFGGVNDDLKVGMKIRVPITKIKKDLKLDE